MTQWIDDMSLAPAGGEWVLGAIELSEGVPEDGVISEVIIFDCGMWTDTRGTVVKPLAWAKITNYAPDSQVNYEWESAVSAWFDGLSLEDYTPTGFVVLGVAVGKIDTGEGALIIPEDALDESERVWNADVLKDIKGDSETLYASSLDKLYSG